MDQIKKYGKKHWFILFLLIVLILVVIIYRHNQFTYWITKNTGSVADWVGNVSIPIVLAWASHQYTIQRERQAKEVTKLREEEIKRKTQRDKTMTVLKILLDLDTLINYELPINPNQQNYQQVYQKVLKNNLELIVKARNEIYAYQSGDTSAILFRSLKTVINMAKNYSTISWDNISYTSKTLEDAEDVLQEEYNYLRETE